MTGEVLNPKPLLEITPEKQAGLESSMGPEGHGAFIVRQAIPDYNLEPLLEEVLNPDCVQLRDVHDKYYNQRGKLIIQNHSVYALKLLQGDPAFINKVPNLRQLATEIEQFIRSLDGIFPPLSDWTADEMSLQHYDDPEIGLSFHRDNQRFIGMIAVASLDGVSDLNILLPDGQIDEYRMEAGDLSLYRAPGIFESDEEIRAEHAVVNLQTPSRTAFIVRANNRPNETLKGFEYDNWDLLPPDSQYYPKAV